MYCCQWQKEIAYLHVLLQYGFEGHYVIAYPVHFKDKELWEVIQTTAV